MKPLLSSISSSDPPRPEPEPDRPDPVAPGEGGRTLVGLPRPTPAAAIALATFLAFGAALGHLGGRWHGAPPARVTMGAPERAFVYNARNAARRADVVLLGDSLMDQGIIPGELADAIGLDRDAVKNLAIHGAKPWDLAWLVDRMEEPRADGPRIAVINVDRAWFDSGEVPPSAYSRYREYQDRLARGPVPIGDRARALLTYAVPERRESRAWLNLITFDWLGYRAPRLVRVPAYEPPRIWDLDPKAQKRAASSVDIAARKSFRSGDFAESSLAALRIIIDRLRSRSYRVVLLMTPLRRDVLELIEASPLSAARERRMRQAILTPPYLGADALVEFRDAPALGIADDDAIFLDYGHLNRLGAEAQTRKLGEALARLGFAGDRTPKPLR